MLPERQTTYGWPIAIEIFLAGIGGGTFLTCLVLDLLSKYESVAEIGTLLGPVLVLVGTFFLLAELGRKAKFYRLFTNLSSLSSWISRGTWILTIFIILGLVYSLPSFWLIDWKTSGLGQGIGIAAGLFSILVVTYPGLFFGVVKGVPLWNTPILSFLFLFSSLCTGIAALFLIVLFSGTALGAAEFHQLGIAGIALIFMLLLALGIYLDIARHQGLAAMESLRLLKTPLFIGGAIVIGLLIPLGLLIYSVFVGNALVLSILTGVVSICMLAGGLFLRYGIIRAGVHLPLYQA